jgi:FMN-dependent NADH-azoreductase
MRAIFIHKGDTPMARLLYIQASPRGSRAHSLAVADAFVAEYHTANPKDIVEVLDVFKADLPAFDGATLDAKYAILHGESKRPEQAEAWKAVEAIIEQFVSFDKFLIASPMWNFGIPYRLKQYIDILVQPGYTFSYDPEKGYEGLIKGKPMALVLARGGQYDGGPADMQRPYLELIMGFIGFTDIHTVVIEPTLAGGPQAAAKAKQAALDEARSLATTF